MRCLLVVYVLFYKRDRKFFLSEVHWRSLQGCLSALSATGVPGLILIDTHNFEPSGGFLFLER